MRLPDRVKWSCLEKFLQAQLCLGLDEIRTMTMRVQSLMDDDDEHLPRMD